MTPTTGPGAALPIASIPACDSVIPVGRAAPSAETPKFPPLTIPFGSVAVKSIVARPPSMKYREPTFQATTALVEGVVEGDVPGAGAAVLSLDAVGSCGSTAATSVSQQPASSVAQPTAPIARALLRLIRLIISSIHQRNFCIKSTHTPSRVATVHDRCPSDKSLRWTSNSPQFKSWIDNLRAGNNQFVIPSIGRRI